MTRMRFFSRVLVGLGEGRASPAAATDVIARAVPVGERSRAVAFVFNGFNVGSVLGLSLAPLIIENFGWRSVFVAFGGLGIFWVAWVGMGIYPRGGAAPGAERAARGGDLAPIRGLLGKREERPAAGQAISAGAAKDAETKRFSPSGPSSSDEDRAVPWRAIVSSTPRARWRTCTSATTGGFYVLLAWLPSYFTQELA